MVLITGVVNVLSQQAVFAFVAGFGLTEYAHAIMVRLFALKVSFAVERREVRDML